jgi:two-component system, LuxR family, response regulator FixJ
VTQEKPVTPEPVVFVVDDDAAIRRSLRFLIESIGLAVETYQTAEQFLDAYNPDRAGCLILDVRMPGMGGLQLQKELADRHVELPIIIVTGYAEVPMAVRALKTGAVDFIEKPFSDQLLLERVREAIESDRHRREARAERDAVSARFARLTAREREVLDGVIAGKANKVIAMELGVGTKTVEAHRAKLMKKLKVDSLADLIRLTMAATRD